MDKEEGKKTRELGQWSLDFSHSFPGHACFAWKLRVDTQTLGNGQAQVRSTDKLFPEWARRQCYYLNTVGQFERLECTPLQPFELEERLGHRLQAVD